MIPETHPSGHFGEGRSPISKTRTPLLYWLFVSVAVYTTIPLIDIPVIKLSLSAPLFIIFFLGMMMQGVRLRLDGVWVILTVLFLAGVSLSSVLGLVARGDALGLSDIVQVLRFIFWGIVFLTTISVAADRSLMEGMLPLMGWGVVCVAGLRIIEGVVFGRIGAWSGTTIMTQNNYGLLFSTFLPVLYYTMNTRSGMGRGLAVIGIIMVLGAVAINGSRGSWIGVLAGSLCFWTIFLLARVRAGRFLTIGAMLFGVVGLAMSVSQVSQVAKKGIMARADTFQRLGKDKTFMARALLVRKGMKIFEKYPMYGVGLNRFKKVDVDLELGPNLEYVSMEMMNKKSAHNSYIQILAETGLLGFVPFVLLILVLLVKGFWSSIALGRMNETWGIVTYASVVGMSIHLWALAGITGTGTWLAFGLLGATIEVANEAGEIHEV